MSVEAMTWAFRQKLPCAHKFVLVALGNQTNPDTGDCFPSQKTIAERCGLSRQHVNKIVADLERDGFLKVTERKRPNGSDTSCSYRLNITLVSTETTPPVNRDDTGVSTETTPGCQQGGHPETKVETKIETKIKPSQPQQGDLLGAPVPKKKADEFPPLPDWIPVEAWTRFIEHRKELGHPVTALAAERIVNKLDRLRKKGQDPGELLDEAVINDWRGVFELKGVANGSGNRNNNGDTGFGAAVRGIAAAVDDYRNDPGRGLP